MITAVLIGKEHTTAFIRTLPGRIEVELRKEIEALAIKLTRKVKQEKLSGTVLKNRTGTLRASINYRIENTPTGIYATVGTNKEYAAAHEYGFRGVVTVRDHLRMMVLAFGRTVTEPRKIQVRSHTRQANIPERSFLRSSLREMSPEIRERISSALKRLANG